MKKLFGEDGCPLEKDYDIKSASVGLSLFSEKDDTDIREMKSKVLNTIAQFCKTSYIFVGKLSLLKCTLGVYYVSDFRV
jgi:hypothetical protein